MRRAQDRARSARFRKNGARSATIEYYGARSATIESRALGALKLASEASCAQSAQRECAREAGRFFKFLSVEYHNDVYFITRFRDFKLGFFKNNFINEQKFH